MARKPGPRLSYSGCKQIRQQLAARGTDIPTLAARIGADSQTLRKQLSGDAPIPDIQELRAILVQVGLDEDEFLRSEAPNAAAESLQQILQAVDEVRDEGRSALKDRIRALDSSLYEDIAELLAASIGHPFWQFISKGDDARKTAFQLREAIHEWLSGWLKEWRIEPTEDEVEARMVLAMSMIRSTFEAMSGELKCAAKEKVKATTLYSTFDAYLVALQGLVEALMDDDSNSRVEVLGVTVVLPSSWFNSPFGFRIHNHPYHFGQINDAMERYVGLVSSLCRKDSNRLSVRRLVLHDGEGEKRLFSDLLEPERRVGEQRNLNFVVPRDWVRDGAIVDEVIRPMDKLDFAEASAWYRGLGVGQDSSADLDSILGLNGGPRHLIVRLLPGDKERIASLESEWTLVSVVDEYVRRLHTEAHDARVMQLKRETPAAGMTVDTYLKRYDALLDLLAIGTKRPDSDEIDWTHILSGSFDMDNKMARLQLFCDRREIQKIGDFWDELHRDEAQAWQGT